MNLLKHIKEEAKERKIPIMLDDGIDFLVNFIKENEIESILEIGSAVGYSAMKMAEVSPKVKVVTIEIDLERYNEAVNNIEQANLQSQIEIHHQDAFTFVSEDQFDLIFIDAAKAQYRRYLERFINNLKQNGVVIIDNMEFHGMVDHPEMTTNRNTKALIRKIKSFRDYLLESEEYLVDYQKEVGDGLMILRRK